MKCPYCQKQIPEDSIYCYHCGKNIIQENNETRQEIKLKQNPKVNAFGKLGLLLFFIGLIVFDFIGGTILNAFQANIKIPFIISSFIYILAVICGIMSMKVDHDDMKKGYEPSGNKNYAYISIFLSLFVALVNLTQVIIK